MDTRTHSPTVGQVSLTMQERMQLLQSTTKKAENGQDVVVRGASKSPTQRDDGGDAAGFTVPEAGRREEDESLGMLEAHP